MASSSGPFAEPPAYGRDRALPLYGTEWERGTGAKNRMKSAAELAGSRCLVQMNCPDSGEHHFGHYASWAECRRHTEGMRGDRRHLFEIIPFNRPCKPYLDLDSKEVPEPCKTVGEVVERVQGLVERVFREDYGIELKPEDYQWMHSPNPAKMSLHLVISTHSPQWLFRTNDYRDPAGARHLARRLHELDPECTGKIVDMNVYTRDRCMRVCGASKFGKDSVLQPLDFERMAQEEPPLAPDETLITQIDEADMELIKVPERMPEEVQQTRRKLSTPIAARAASSKEPIELSMARSRMLELMREKVHPTAFIERPGSDEDPYDGIRFNYTDRAEPCYTGQVHGPTMNLKCYVDGAGDVICRCFSPLCEKDPPRRLGPLHADPEVALADAIQIDSRFLGSESPGQLAAAPGLEAALRAWIAGRPKCLSIRSPMGTGKTTLLQNILQELTTITASRSGIMSPNPTALVITYRQTLAMEQIGKLTTHGFVSYLELEGDAPLDSRSDFPRLICQMESLPRLVKLNDDIEPFDLVIVDEIESVLRHFNSPTVKGPALLVNLVQELLRRAKHVITMDALWGNASHNFLKTSEIPNRLVHNVVRTPPRTFTFTNDGESWRADILQDLSEGCNIVVASLSSEQVYRIRDAILASGLISEDEVLLHTSKTSDSVKKLLADVNSLWTKYRIVMYSPSVSAGVDFSTQHFDRLYLYVCPLSCTPMSALQMTGRVRSLKVPSVQCCASPGMKLRGTAKSRSVTVAEMIRFIMWMDNSLRERRFGIMPMQRLRVQEKEGLEGGHYSLPQQTALLQIQALGEAERLNSASRFILEFRDLAESMGHTVTIGSDVSEKTAIIVLEELLNQAAQPPAAPGEPSGNVLAARRLLAVPDIDPDSDEFRDIQRRITTSNATEQEKWIEFKVIYKRYWGIDRIDEAFLLENGLQPHSAEAHQLVRVLYPPMGALDTARMSVASRASLLRAPLIREVIEALGFASPFDTEHRIPDLMAVWEARLKKTALFSRYRETARLFTKAGTTTKWDLRTVRKALNMVLRTIGLSLDFERSRSKHRGETTTTYVYWLNPDEIARMLELVRLRMRGCPNRSATPNDHARPLLLLDEFPRYGRLVDLARPRKSAYAFIIDPEEALAAAAREEQSGNSSTLPATAE